jgi:hypothetical protein
MHKRPEVIEKRAVDVEVQVIELEGVGSTTFPRGKRNKTMPTRPARKSSRLQGPDASLWVVERAQSRTASKNLDETGNPDSLGDFTFLHKLHDSHLASVAHDFGLPISIEAGSESQILLLIKTKRE